MADLALWPLLVVAAGDDLARVQAEIDADVGAVYAFLARHGVDTTSVRLHGLEVTDRLSPRGEQMLAGGRLIPAKATFSPAMPSSLRGNGENSA